jgi:hypothetical protein
MTSTFDQLRDDTQSIRSLLEHHSSQVYHLTLLLNQKTEQLSKVCQHEYEEERDDDYHKPGRYYVCRFCKDFTRFKPSSIEHPPKRQKNISHDKV